MAAIGYKMRQILRETPEFKAFSGKYAYQHFAESRCWQDIFAAKKSFLTVIGIGAMVGALVWTFSTYTSYYLTKVAGWSTTDAIPVTLVGLVGHICVLLLIGFLGDRVGFRPIMSVAAFCTLVLAYPLFYLLTHDFAIYAQIGFALLAGAYGAAIHAVMVNLFPVAQRCRAISVGFSIGISLGGASPMIAASLVAATGNEVAPAFYIMLIALFGLWAILSRRPYESFKKERMGSALPQT